MGPNQVISYSLPCILRPSACGVKDKPSPPRSLPSAARRAAAFGHPDDQIAAPEEGTGHVQALLDGPQQPRKALNSIPFQPEIGQGVRQSIIARGQ